MTSDRVELLTVEDRFHISGVGVVLRPDFSVPNGHWADRSETVTVVRPDGQHFEALAHFGLSHFNISDPRASIDRRWRVTVLLEVTGTDVPVGSKLLVPDGVKSALFPGTLG